MMSFLNIAPKNNSSPYVPVSPQMNPNLLGVKV